MFYTKIIENLKKETDEIILFHSGTGKDSIMLCDVLSKNFKKVHCIFMYIVKNLEYENKYIQWAEKKYNNIYFYQTPHFCIYSFIKNGYLGIKKDENIGKMSIAKIDTLFKKKLNIKWSVYGFKKNDGITRRFMLKDTDNGINHNTKKVYPLMDLSNKDVLNYITDNTLIYPFSYDKNIPSTSCDISKPLFLKTIKEKYPNDLRKIFNQFPFTEAILYRYENKTERNNCN